MKKTLEEIIEESLAVNPVEGEPEVKTVTEEVISGAPEVNVQKANAVEIDKLRLEMKQFGEAAQAAISAASSVQARAALGSSSGGVGPREVKTLITANTVATNDQAASNYIDIGTMRLQWGAGVAGTPVVFGVVFGTAPTVTATIEGAGSDRVISANPATTTGISINSWNTGTNVASSGENLTWIAIGLKP